MKFILITMLCLPLVSTYAATKNETEKAQTSYLKCIRYMAKLRVSPRETMPETFKQLQNLVTNKKNAMALENGTNDCQNKLEELRQKERISKKDHVFITREMIFNMHYDPNVTDTDIKGKSYFMLRDLFEPKFNKCSIVGAVANLAVVGGVHLGLSMGICSTTDGYKYQIFATEAGFALGIGAFVGLHLTTTDELGDLENHEAITIAAVGGFSINDAYRSLGIGAGVIYADANTHIFKMIRVKKNYFKPLLEDLN